MSDCIGNLIYSEPPRTSSHHVIVKDVSLLTHLILDSLKAGQHKIQYPRTSAVADAVVLKRTRTQEEPRCHCSWPRARKQTRNGLLSLYTDRTVGSHCTGSQLAKRHIQAEILPTLMRFSRHLSQASAAFLRTGLKPGATLGMAKSAITVQGA